MQGGVREKRLEGKGEVNPIGHIHQAVIGLALDHHLPHVDPLGDDEVIQGGILTGLLGDDQIVDLHHLQGL
jgi:hypothetical protein